MDSKQYDELREELIRRLSHELRVGLDRIFEHLSARELQAGRSGVDRRQVLRLKGLRKAVIGALHNLMRTGVEVFTLDDVLAAMDVKHLPVAVSCKEDPAKRASASSILRRLSSPTAKERMIEVAKLGEGSRSTEYRFVEEIVKREQAEHLSFLEDFSR